MSNFSIDEKLINFLLFIPLFLISLSLHEFAHAYFAYRKGDSTAKDMGRMTLNPIKHLDLVGSIIMPFLSFVSGFMLIGWAKPVPVDHRNFKNPYKDDAIVSVAGPASNFLLALVFLSLIAILQLFELANNQFIFRILLQGIYFNLFLFLFNLLPIPPLDGSHILFDLFPNKFTAKYLSIGFMGSIILMFLIYSPIWQIFIGAIQFIFSFLWSIKELVVA